MKRGKLVMIAVLVMTVLLMSGCSVILDQVVGYLNSREEVEQQTAVSNVDADDRSDVQQESAADESVPANTFDTGSIQYSPVVCGDTYTAVIKDDGSLWAWGRSSVLFGDMDYYPEPVHLMDDVAAISGRSCFSVIKTDGTLWAWGGGLSEDSENMEPIYMLDDVIAVSSNRWHGLALRSDHSLWAYGSNAYGAVGDGSEEDRTEPVHIMDDVVDIWTMDLFSYAIKADGTLWRWGDYGREDIVRIPQCVDEGVTDVWGYSQHILYKLADGTLRYISNVDILDVEWYIEEDPESCGGILNIPDVRLAADGDAFVVVLKEDDTLWGWGNNSDYTLGIGEVKDVIDPVQVMDSVEYVTVGGNSRKYHSAAVKTDGSLWVWGCNENGELGTGTCDYDAHTTPECVMENIMLPQE